MVRKMTEDNPTKDEVLKDTARLDEYLKLWTQVNLIEGNKDDWLFDAIHAFGRYEESKGRENKFKILRETKIDI